MQTDQNLEREIQRLKSAIEELTLLNDLALAASLSLDVNQVLDTIVQKSVKAVKAEQGSIMLVTPQQDSPLKTLIRKEDFSGAITGYRVGTHISGWVLKNKQPLIIEDLTKDERFNVSLKEMGDIRTVLCVPIMTRAQLIGVLIMTNKKTGEPFNKDDLRLLSIIAAQSGQLIHNSELQQEAVEKKRLEHQLQMAKEIQLDLVPKSDPHNKFLEISSFFKPADAVGGDYFDYFNLSEDKLGVVIADVSGHGPRAALVMTMIKGILHSITHNYQSAENTLKEINAIISGIMPTDVFVTMQFLVFDFSDHSLSIANAGHNPVLHYVNKKEICQRIEIDGCALNILPDFDYSSGKVNLDAGDYFLIYTDGINEACNEKNDMFRITGLVDAIEEKGQVSSRQLIDHIRQQLRAFTGDLPQADDMIIIAIQVK